MRVTSHNGRWGSPKHNGRNFDAERAGHIDAGRVSQNQYWVWDMEAEEMDPEAFEGSELRYYNEQFGAALAAQNERHRKHGDHKRVRTMEEVMSARQRRPEESIWQIGDMNAGTDPEVFMECVNEYMAFQMDWSEEHGNPFQFLNAAVHLDEASPHAHVRRVWQYQDAAGVWQIGQNKALEAAGVPLPDPTKPEGAKNNRKMVFDAMCREKWLDICEAHGFTVEREADASHTNHIPKEQYIELQERVRELQAKEAASTARIATLEAEAVETVAKAETALTEAEKAKRELFQLRNRMFQFLQSYPGAIEAYAEKFGLDAVPDELRVKAARRAVETASKIEPKSATQTQGSSEKHTGPKRPPRHGSFDDMFADYMKQQDELQL